MAIPSYHNGEWGLVALQAFEQKRTGMPFNFIGDWQNQLDHLLWQEEERHRTQTVSLTQLLEYMKDDASQESTQQMQINVEFASPKDFIPLPSQWEMHSQYIDRYGGIDVFYFDFYSIALSKIERGTTRDIEDVKLLVQQQRITLDELDAAYQEVLAQLGKGQYPKITPEHFAARYTAIRPLL
ncbi:MAG: hypothetical protein NVS4B11_29710 [Ktedonobacteraceae bacterium]